MGAVFLKLAFIIVAGTIIYMLGYLFVNALIRFSA